MFSDDDLRSYLDGKAPDALAQRIEAELTHDTGLEDRLMALDEIAPLVRSSLAHLPAPSETQMTAWTRQETPKTQSWSWLAAGVLIGALIVGGAWWMTPQQTPGWRSAVASYQALYSKETVAKLSFTSEELRQQLREAEASVEATGLYDLVSGLEGLRLARSQVLAHKGAPLVQIVLITETGEPVALCLMQASSEQAERIEQVVPREGLASVAFDSVAHTWLLIGTEDNALIEAAGLELGARLGIDA